MMSERLQHGLMLDPARDHMTEFVSLDGAGNRQINALCCPGSDVNLIVRRAAQAGDRVPGMLNSFFDFFSGAV